MFRLPASVVQQFAELVVLDQSSEVLADSSDDLKDAFGVCGGFERKTERVFLGELFGRPIPNRFSRWIVLEVVKAPTRCLVLLQNL